MARPAKRARIDTPTEGGSSTTAREEEDASLPAEDEVVPHGIVLAMTCHKNVLGAAYLDLARDCLYLLEDALDTDKHDLAALIVEQVRPVTVLVSSRADDSFSARIKQTMDTLADDHADMGLIKLRPRVEWNPFSGRQSLARLRIHTASHLEADMQSLQGTAASHDVPIQFDIGSFTSTSKAEVMFGAIACLFNYYRQHTIEGELPDPEHGIAEVSSVESIALEKMLHINGSALHALQIFDEQSHANAYSDRTKEGLSLYGILNRTRTPAGKLLLKHWLLRPSTEIDLIEARHDAIECFLHVVNETSYKACYSALRGVTNITNVLRAIKEGKSKWNSWFAVHKFAGAAIGLREALLSLRGHEQVQAIGRFLDSFEERHFRDLGTLINSTIDWEESKTQGRICIKPLVDEELDEVRADLASLDSKLTHMGERMSDDVPPEFADSLDIVYFPQLGYLCKVPLKAEGEEIDPPGEDWVRQFATEDGTYWKNGVMQYCDEKWGDLHSIAAAKEIEIVHELQRQLEMDYETQIRCAVECVAELDVLLSLAGASNEYSFVRPKMSQHNVCRIQGGRHPLVERCVPQYVPNDTVLVRIDSASAPLLPLKRDKVGGRGVKEEEEAVPLDNPSGLSPNQSILILTGANGSGKSVYLKAVAIIVFLAHCGCFVPAEQALIGITDAIYTRVASVESASQDASAFTIDLQQISYMLRNCTNRSLLIVDEFGKGTESTDGAGLLTGLVNHLVHRGLDTPKTLIATHYHAIFANQLLDRSLPLLLAHMELLIEEGREKQSSVTHLFRLAAGLATTSHAVQCAEANGIDPRVTQRAAHVSAHIASHAVTELLDAALGERDKSELRATAARVTRFLELDLDALEVADDVHAALGRIVREEMGDDA